MRAFRFLLALLFMCLSTAILAQDASSAEELLNQVLYLDFDARLLSSEGKLLWQVQNKAYTISGRTVDVRLEGSNVLAISHLTPYLKEDSKVLLVAQGEVWYNRDRKEDMKYYSGMTSIPVSLGESALFFPLGVEAKKGKGSFIIEIEITVDRYVSLKEQQ